MTLASSSMTGKRQPHFVDIQVGVLEGLVAFVEALPLIILPGKGLDHPVARNVFQRSGVHFAEPVTSVLHQQRTLLEYSLVTTISSGVTASRASVSFQLMQKT